MKMNFSKIFNDKKNIIFLIISVLIMGLAFIINSDGQESSFEGTVALSETSVLERGTFQEVVTENGYVTSENFTFVYPGLESEVLEINVDIGDTVKKGDVLARLDISNINAQIASKEENARKDSQKRTEKIEEAQANLNEALSKINTSSDPGLRSAEESINRAYSTWQEVNNKLEAQKTLVDNMEETINSKEKTTSNTNTSSKTSSQIQGEIDKLDTEKTNIESKIGQIKEEISLKEHQRASYMNIVNQNGLSYSGSADLAGAKVRLNELKAEHNPNPQPGPSTEIVDEKGETVEIPGPTPPPVDNSSQIASLESGISAMESIASIDSSISGLKDGIYSLEGDLIAIDQKKTSLSIDLEEVKNKKPKEEKPKSSGSDEDKLKASKDRLIKLEEEVVKAEKDYLKALDRLDLERLENRNKSNSENKKIEELKKKLNYARSQEDALENLKLDKLQNQLSYEYVIAPTDGIISEINMEIGQSPGDYVVKIATSDRTLVESKINEYDMDKVSQGTEALVSPLEEKDPNKGYKGKVESIYPELISPSDLEESESLEENTSNYYKSVIEFDNQLIEGLSPGMDVKVRYIIRNENEVMVVPTKSLVKSGSKNYLFVINQFTNEVEKLQVSIHGENQYQSIIESPQLSDGLIYINYPDNYFPGQKLNIIDDSKGNIEALDLDIKQDERYL